MALNSSKNLPALMPSKAKNGSALVNEKIDERILRLLGLEDIFDIDYDTYSSLLRERMAAARMTKQTIATEEVEMITDEWKRIKGKKGRFKVKKITAASFKKGTAFGINLKNKKLVARIKPLALPPAADEIKGQDDTKEIIGLLGEIIKNLTLQNKVQKSSNERSRKEAEDAKRGLAESRLEKGFSAAIKVAEKIIAPVKSLLNRIIDFITQIFIGRSIVLLLEWFGNKDNRDKVQSIIRFFGDHWPKLLALYIRFGTQFGRFVGGLSKLVISGTLRLVQLAAKLVGAKGAARFLGGWGGKLLGAGLTVATTVGTTMALSSGIENFAGLENLGKEPPPKTPGYFGGGLAQFKNLLGFFGGGPGFVSGQKGIDKVPAMLTDGEFVMSRGAVQKYGVGTLESMNAAGGGTNRPRMINGATYAYGGGLVGTDRSSDSSYRKNEQELKKQKKEENISGRAGSPGAALSVQQRVQRIEKQLAAQKALSSGGLSLKGTQGFDIGKGYAASYKGRDSIVVKDAVKQGTRYGDIMVEPEITIAGKRYFAQQKGNDIIYSSNFARGLSGQVDKYGARNKSYQGKGAGILGGFGLKRDNKSLPKTKIMMGPDGPFVGYLRFRGGQPEYARPTERKSGFLEQLTNLFDPKGARSRQETLNARSMRLSAITDLEQYRKEGMTEDNIKKMLGPNLYKNAINDSKAKQSAFSKKNTIIQDSHRAQERNYYKNRGIGGMGGLGSSYRGQELQLSAKANAARISPTKPKTRQLTPPSRQPVVVRTKPVGSGNGGVTKSSGGRPRTPNFGASCPSSNAPRSKKILGIF
jgi:hypothetical protein